MTKIFSKNRLLITIVFSVLVTAIISTSGYYIYKHLKQPSITPMQAIPADALLIVKIKSTPATWNEIVSKTDLWIDMAKFEDFKQVNTTTHWLDSLIHSNALSSKIAAEQTLYVSAHSDAQNQLSLLYTIEIPKDFENGITDFLNSISKSENMQKQTIDGIPTYQSTSKSGFSFYLHKGVFSGSYNLDLLKSSIKQVSSKKNLENDSLFQEICLSEGKKTPISLFINHQQIYTILSEQFKPEIKKSIRSFNLFNGWSNTNVLFRKDLSLMSGYLATNSMSFLNCIKDVIPQKATFTNELDENTFFFYAINFNDFNSYRKLYTDYQKNNKITPPIAEYFSQDSSCDLKWATNFWERLNPTQLVLSYSSVQDSAVSLITVKPKDIIDAQKIIINEAVGVTPQKEKVDTGSYKGYKIGKLSLQYSARLFGDQLFSSTPISYYGIGKEHIIFASTKGVIKYTIDQTNSDKTLENSYLYKSYSNDLNSEALLSIYFSPAQALTSISKYLDTTKQSNRLIEMLAKNTPYLGIQIGKFYNKLASTSFCWKYLTSTFSETSINRVLTSDTPEKEKVSNQKKGKKKSIKKQTNKKQVQTNSKANKAKINKKASSKKKVNSKN
ncbi:MAG: hypothetical protein WCP69_06150 [Bacteroidota bacterium]